MSSAVEIENRISVMTSRKEVADILLANVLRCLAADELATANMLLSADDSLLASQLFHPEITECFRRR